MAKIYNLRNNKQNNKTQATKPVSLSLNKSTEQHTTPSIDSTQASKFNLQLPTKQSVTSKKPKTVTVNGIGMTEDMAKLYDKAKYKQAEADAKRRAEERQQALIRENFERAMKPGEWYGAIVDNTNVHSGTKLNDYGYLTAHCKDAKDGEFIRVNSLGEVMLVEQGELSDDERIAIEEFKADYNRTRDTYDTYMSLQELAMQGAQNTTTNIDDPHQVNSIMDILVNLGNDLVTNIERKINLMETPAEWHIKEDLQDYMQLRALGRVVINETVGKEALKELGIEDWEQLQGVQSIKDFLALDINEDAKAYFAYQAIGDEQAKGTSWEFWLSDALTELGEDGDWASQIIKNAFNYEGDDKFAWANSTHSETGRMVYQYDTGDWFEDVVMETICDPGNWLLAIATFGGSVAAKAGVSAAASAATDAGAEFAEGTMKAFRRSIADGMSKGLSSDKIAINALKVADVMDERAIKELTEALEYGRASKLARSLGTANTMYQKADDAFMFLSKVGGEFLPLSFATKGVRALASIPAVSKAAADAFSTITSGAYKALNVFNMSKWVDKTNQYILGLNAVDGTVLPGLPAEFKRKAVIEANIKMCDEITAQLANNYQYSFISQLLETASDGQVKSFDDYYTLVTKLSEDLSIDLNELYAPIKRLQNTYNSIQAKLTKDFAHTVVESFNTVTQTLDTIIQDTNIPDVKQVQLLYNAHNTYKSIAGRVMSIPDQLKFEKALAAGTPEALTEAKNILADYIVDYSKRAHYDNTHTVYTLPNRDVVAETQHILAHPTDASELKKYIGSVSTVGENTLLSDVDGKVYQAMVSKSAMADLEAADVQLNRMYNSIINREPGAGQTIANAAFGGDAVALQVVERAYATSHYMSIKGALKKSNIPDELQEGLVDALYSLNNRFRNATRLGTHQSTLDISDAARRLTKDSYDHAIKYYNLTHTGTCNKFLELECNTANTAENVKRIAEQYAMYNKDLTHTPVYYSVKMRGDMGGVEEISFMTADGTVRTLRNQVEGGIPTHQKFYTEVRACLDEIKESSNVRGTHKPIQYVGFNNHSSGFDTDYLLGRQFRLYNTGLGLYDTIDVADLKRVELGMPVVSEDWFSEYSRILQDELNRYMSERIMYPNLRSVFTPIQDDVIIDEALTQLIDNNSTPLAEALEPLSIRLKTIHKQIGDLNSMYKDLGNMFVYNEADIMAMLRKLPENSKNLVITVKRAYDSRIVNKFFSTTNDPELAGVLFELAEEANANLKNLQNYQLVRTFSDAELNKRIKDMLKFNKLEYTVSDGMDKAQKVALLVTLCDKAPGGKQKPVWLMYPQTALEVALSKPHTMLYANGLKFANFYEDVHSIVDNPASKINQANETLKEIEAATQSLEKYTTYIEARETALQQAGVTNSIQYAKYLQQREVTEPFRQFINEVHRAVEVYNEQTKEFTEHYRRRYAHANKELEQRAAYVGELDKEILAFESNKSISEITDAQATHEVLSGVDEFNAKMYAFSQMRDATRIKYVAMLDADNFKAHLIKDCNGRMVIDTTYKPFSTNELEKIAQHQAIDPRIKSTYDGRFYKMWYDTTGMTDEELLDLVEAYKNYEGPVAEIRASHDEGAGYGLNVLLESIEKYSHNTLSYGAFDPNTMHKVAYMDSKFFSDCEGLLPHGLLNEMNCFTGTYNCMYHGDITVLSADSNNFMSNNVITNLCSAYTNVLNNMDTVNDMLRFVTRPEASFKNFVQNIRTLDGVQGARNVAKAVKDNGYVVGAVTLNKGKYNVVEIDISNPALYKAALKQKSTFVVRYDAFAQLRKAAEFKTISSGNLKQTSTFFRHYNDVRQLYIQSYLFTRYSTWVRNAVDSTMKGVTQEGPSHLQYMIDAHKAMDVFNDVEVDIKRKYRRVNVDTINEYFTKNTASKLTRDEFLILKTYFDNPLSGTQAERLLNQFKVDPYTALKGYADMDLPEEYVRKAIDIIEEVDKLNAPHYTKWSAVYDQLKELYGSEVAANLTGMYTRYAQLKNTGSTISLTDIPVLGKWFEFNAKRFSDVETINRLAIYLNELDKGSNVGKALQKISESQFDYTKSDLLRKVESVAPFTTFKLYNIEYWTDTVFKYHWGQQTLKRMSDLYESMTDKDDNGYWTEESMSYRAMIDMYLDTLENDNYTSDYVYEYQGVESDDAFTYGWVSVGDRLYFKAGNSFVDAISGYDTSVEDKLFAPIQSIITLIKEGKATDDDLATYVAEHAYELTSLLPVIGTLYYSAYSTMRNAKIASEPEDLLAVLSPSLFAVSKESTSYDKYANSYYAKPVGFDWYNQSEEYRKNHRYVMGVSYIPTWMSKDPATYINTWGRMEQMGLSEECIQELFTNNGAWWFTKDGNTYNLHNYNLMIHDQATWDNVYNTLLRYGWSAERATNLMNRVAIPTWHTNSNYADYTGYGAYSNAKYSGQINTLLSGSKAALNTAKYNMGRYSGSGKWSQYDTMPDTHRKIVHQVKGHDPSRTSKKYQKAYRWHRRTRDIYRDNYAKYGASRMAMEQNLRAYSNRSITEMRRTNMNIRYARIHNRWWAS